jgi:hypothetical protein
MEMETSPVIHENTITNNTWTIPEIKGEVTVIFRLSKFYNALHIFVLKSIIIN